MRECWEIGGCSFIEGLNCPSRQSGKSCWLLRKCFKVSRSARNQCPVFNEHKKEMLTMVKRAQHGEQEATEELVKTFSRYVFQAGKKFFIPGGTIEDLYQEGFIGLFKAIVSFDERKNMEFEDYVSLSIRNSILRAVRYATQKKRLLLTNAKSIDEDYNTFKNIASFHNPEKIVMGEMAAETLLDFIDSKLTDSERKILKLKTANYSVDEIVEIEGKDKKIVENALYRSRRKIKLSYLNKKQKRINAQGKHGRILKAV